MSGDPEQEYFADGMVEEIITALSRIRWLFVIARNSTFTYKGQAVDVKQVGRELGVRYVLEGSVRKAGNRVRITAQLIDADTGTHLWADRFDGSLDDLFELQDQMRRASPGSSSRHCKRPRCAAPRKPPTTASRLRSLSARACGLRPSHLRRADSRGSELARAGDRARSGVTGLHLPGPAICYCRLVIDGRATIRETIVPQEHRSRSAGLERRRRPEARAHLASAASARHPARISAMIGTGRPRAGAQPELCPRLVFERPSQGICRPARSRDRARRDLSAAEPARPRIGAPLSVIGLAHFSAGASTKRCRSCFSRHPRRSGLPESYRILAAALCPYGPARRSARDRRAAACHYPQIVVPS